MIPIPKTSQSQDKISLDWKAYFTCFCEAHGGDPIEYKGRWLFGDGWGYSLTDYKGPEYEPPASLEEKRLLLLAYWTRKQRMVKALLARMRGQVEMFRNVQKEKSCPLQEVVRLKDEAGTMRSEVRPLDLTRLLLRVEALTADAKKCEDELLRLYKKE